MHTYPYYFSSYRGISLNFCDISLSYCAMGVMEVRKQWAGRASTDLWLRWYRGGGGAHIMLILHLIMEFHWLANEFNSICKTKNKLLITISLLTQNTASVYCCHKGKSVSLVSCIKREELIDLIKIGSFMLPCILVHICRD